MVKIQIEYFMGYLHIMKRMHQYVNGFGRDCLRFNFAIAILITRLNGSDIGARNNLILVKLFKKATTTMRLFSQVQLFEKTLSWLLLDLRFSVFRCFSKAIFSPDEGKSISCGRYHAKVKWGLSSLSQGLSIYLSEWIIGLDLPQACIDGQGGVR